jgi:hypothetical protein
VTRIQKKSYYVTLDYKYFKTVAKFNYSRARLKNDIYIGEDVKCSLNRGKCLLPLGSESFRFPFAVYRRRNLKERE